MKNPPNNDASDKKTEKGQNWLEPGLNRPNFDRPVEKQNESLDRLKNGEERPIPKEGIFRDAAEKADKYGGKPEDYKKVAGPRINKGGTERKHTDVETHAVKKIHEDGKVEFLEAKGIAVGLRDHGRSMTTDARSEKNKEKKEPDSNPEKRSERRKP